MTLDVVDVRRAFHQIPEIGFQEEKTQSLLLKYIKQLPQDKITIKKWRTGLLVKVHGTSPEKTIGYRADIDGLPITEDTGYTFSSKHDGFMHACGHDFHITIGLAVLEQLTLTTLKDDVVFIFQPAEEGPGGALPMLKCDAFNDWLPDMMFALHIAPEYPVGTIATKEGLLFANTSELFIDFKGKGGHAAYPHLANDMVIAASAFVTQAQSIISRRIDPLDSAVITIGKITGGSKQNIIAETARLEGTMRALKPQTMINLKGQIEALVKGIEIAYDCQATIDYGSNYYQVYNEKNATRDFIQYCQDHHEAIRVVTCSEAMTGEDFGYFLKEIPGFMFWLGVDSEAGLHAAQLKPDEAAIEKAVKIVTGYIIEKATR